MPKMNRDNQGWKEAVQNFTPSWFLVNMGTGIVSVLLHNLPYNGTWLYWLSVIFFVLNVALFVLFLAISILRYTLWPSLWKAMIRHPTQSFFLAAFPMGFATIIDMIVFVCVPAFGERFTRIAWALFWIDAGVALAICFYLPFVVMYIHTTELKDLTAVWLLPVLPPVVAAATGAIVADVLPNPQHALITVIMSYILWGIGVPLAMVFMVVYFHRLIVHKLPPREVIVSVFVPVGPLGKGGYGIEKLGMVAMKTFPETGTLSETTTAAGDILYVVGFLMGVMMWGLGLAWIFFAIASVTRSRFPFNIGWWGCIFPLGVFATSAVQLGMEIPSAFFNIVGTILSVIVMLLWLIVAAGTCWKAVTGDLIFAPRIREVEEGKGAKASKNPGDDKFLV